MQLSLLLKRILYLALVIAFAAYVYFVQNAEGLTPYLLALALIPLYRNRITSYLIVFSTTAFLSLIVLLPNFFHLPLPGLLLLLLIVLAVSLLISMKYKGYTQPALILITALFMYHQRDLYHAYDADVTTLLVLFSGIALCIIRLIALPPLSSKYNKHSFKYLIKGLNELAVEIFSSLNPDYKSMEYVYEKRLHEVKNDFFKIVKYVKRQNLSDQAIIKDFYHLYEILIDCSLLRWRIKDFHTLQLCSEEIKNLLGKLSLLLSFRTQTFESDLKNFREAIQRFDDNFESVIQITERNPLPYLMLIYDLNALSYACEKTFQHLKARLK